MSSSSEIIGSFDIGVGLHDEVMDEICLKIHAEDLWPLRTITPDWSRRVMDRNWISTHYLASKSSNAGIIFNFLRDGPLNALLRFDNRFQSLGLTPFVSHPSLSDNVAPEIVGICLGLVCVIYEHVHRYCFAFCNPATSRILRFDDPTDGYSIGRRTWFFGFDPFNNLAYFLLVFEDLEYDRVVRWLQYTSKDLEWEGIMNPIFEYDIWFSDVVCSDGHLYWISEPKGDSDSAEGFLMRYCPRDEQFMHFDLPLIGDVLKVSLLEYDGCVGYLSTVASDNNAYNYTLWLFQNLAGSPPFWKKEISFNGVPSHLRNIGLVNQKLLCVEIDNDDEKKNTQYVNTFPLSLVNSDGTLSVQDTSLLNGGPTVINSTHEYTSSLVRF